MAHYVDNSDLNQAIIDYNRQRNEAIAAGLPEPLPNDFIGKAILDIANGLATKHSYRQYTWLDEMVGDAITNMSRAIKKYDPAISSNAHAFLTKTAIWAFHARIHLENKNLARRIEMMVDVTQDYFVQGIDGTTYHIPREEILEMMSRD